MTQGRTDACKAGMHIGVKHRVECWLCVGLLEEEDLRPAYIGYLACTSSATPRLHTQSMSLYIQRSLEPSSDTRSYWFDLINGIITLMTDKNSKDSFHTVILHQDNLTHRADVCTLKACYNLI